jgi:hypothetical protein
MGGRPLCALSRESDVPSSPRTEREGSAALPPEALRGLRYFRKSECGDSMQLGKAFNPQ